MTFQKGSRVQYTHIQQRGKQTVMATRTGRIITLSNDTATVLPDGKARAVRIVLDRLQHEGEEPALMTWLEGVFARNRQAMAAAWGGDDGKPALG